MIFQGRYDKARKLQQEQMNGRERAYDDDTLADKLEKNVKGAFDNEEYAGKITLSIGIAAAPDHGDDFETLYKNADKALYEAKNSGKACFKLFK